MIHTYIPSFIVGPVIKPIIFLTVTDRYYVVYCNILLKERLTPTLNNKAGYRPCPTLKHEIIINLISFVMGDLGGLGHLSDAT